MCRLVMNSNMIHVLIYFNRKFSLRLQDILKSVALEPTRKYPSLSKHTPEPQNHCFLLNSSSSPTLNCKTQFDWSMLNAVISHLLRIRIIVIYIVAKIISLRQLSVSRTILKEEKIYTV